MTSFLHRKHHLREFAMRRLFNQYPLMQSAAAPYLLGVGGLAAATYICFQVGFGISRTSFVFLL